jgi:hypothetical protein
MSSTSGLRFFFRHDVLPLEMTRAGGLALLKGKEDPKERMWNRSWHRTREEEAKAGRTLAGKPAPLGTVRMRGVT